MEKASKRPGEARWSHNAATVGLIIAVAVFARLRTFSNPVVGFDEQFYLLVGDRMLEGAIPYVDIFDRKPIGLFLIYAFVRGFGGTGFVEYKLLALASVVATAYVIFLLVRHHASRGSAILAALAYVAWLNFMEGEGGQTPVFYNLPMAAAALVIARAHREPKSILRSGIAAMGLVGIALQIKYSVVFEGVFFGCWLLGLAWRQGWRGVALLGAATAWVAAALLPTLAALLAYAAMGHADAFVFANFVSVLALGRGAFTTEFAGAAVIVGIVTPLVALVVWPPRGCGDAFLLGWLVAATIGLVAFRRFASPHYGLPLLPPLVCLVGVAVDRSRTRQIAGAILVAAGLVGGQVVLAASEHAKGGAAAADAVARAADPHGRGCIYVYDGYPALYLLTHSCLPTRWVFPGHLNTMEEAHAGALGVDPVAEERRILATHPVAIVDDYPRFAGGNRATHRVLQQVLDRSYVLTACIRTGRARFRLVYRRDGAKRATDCPDARLLDADR